MSPLWPFVGRQAELHLIHDAMNSENCIVLAGPAGVGKTRLGYEAIAGADQCRFWSVWTAAMPATTPIPLGPFAPLLPARSPTHPLGRPRDAIEEILGRCGTRKLALGVADAHLLDEVSAALVYHLARTGRAFVLVSLRSRHPAPDSIRALWKDGLASRIEVEPLSAAAVHAVLVAALGSQVDELTSRRLWRATRGNLLLLRELVGAGIEQGALSHVAGVWRWNGPWVTTPQLVELIGDRIGRLNQREQQVLELVAYGEPLGADVLISLTDRHTVEDMEARDLLCARQDGRRVDVRLGHPLYGEVLRANCSPRRAATVRRELADAIEAVGARRADDWLRIATWRIDAGAPVRPDVLVAAAGRAFAALDLPRAERLARMAFAAGSDPSAGAVLWRVLLFAQRAAEIEDVMARLADMPMSAPQRGDYAIGRACNLFWGLHRINAAFTVLRTTRNGLDDPAWRDEIELLEGSFQLFLANLHQAERDLAGLRRRPGLTPRVLAQALVVHAVALVHLGRLGQAWEQLHRAAEPLSDRADQIPWLVAASQVYRCYAALFAGELTKAQELAIELHRHALETEWEFLLRLSYSAQVKVALLRGRVGSAIRWARDACRRGHRPGGAFTGHVFGELAHAEALAGDPAAARAALAEADRCPAPSEALLQPWTELARAWVAAASHDLSQAAQQAVATADYLRAQGAASFEAVALHDAVRLGAAHAVVHRLRELAGMVDGRLVPAFAEHAAAAVDGDPVRLERSGDAFAGLGADLLAAEAYVQAARSTRNMAHDRRLRARAARLLTDCEGARTPLVADLVAPRLTERERSIAVLAAQGRSNQEIGNRLMISSRTVGNHLHHVYMKLGISGRGELANLLPATWS